MPITRQLLSKLFYKTSSVITNYLSVAILAIITSYSYQLNSSYSSQNYLSHSDHEKYFNIIPNFIKHSQTFLMNSHYFLKKLHKQCLKKNNSIIPNTFSKRFQNILNTLSNTTSTLSKTILNQRFLKNY